MRIDPLNLAIPKAGDRVAGLLLPHADLLQDGDIVVIDSSVVATAEGRTETIGSASERAEVAERHSQRILRRTADGLISETPHGFIANDAAIWWPAEYPGQAVLLPEQPDRSAHKVADGLRAKHPIEVGVIIAHGFTDPWRQGSIYRAIGVAKVAPVVAGMATADALAAAASLTMADAYAAVIREADPDLFGPGSVQAQGLRPLGDQLFH